MITKKEFTNLYNVSDKKTIKTINYINILTPDESMTLTEANKFNNIILEALSLSTANQMLDRIGYEYNERPKIYKEAKTK